MIAIRKFQSGDEAELYKIFHEAVHIINARDYSQEQLDAWAPAKNNNEASWRDSLLNNHTFVAVDTQKGIIVGFIDIQNDGYIDRLYIRPGYTDGRVALLLYRQIEYRAKEIGITELFANVSITAKPVLEFMRFTTEAEQVVYKNGVSFINYRMRKCIV